jgi:hypothetical protein
MMCLGPTDSLDLTHHDLLPDHHPNKLTKPQSLLSILQSDSSSNDHPLVNETITIATHQRLPITSTIPNKFSIRAGKAWPSNRAIRHRLRIEPSLWFSRNHSGNWLTSWSAHKRANHTHCRDIQHLWRTWSNCKNSKIIYVALFQLYTLANTYTHTHITTHA